MWPLPAESLVYRALVRAEDDVSARDLLRSLRAGRLFGPRVSEVYDAIRRLEEWHVIICRDEYGGPWRAASSERVYRLSDTARAGAQRS